MLLRLAGISADQYQHRLPYLIDKCGDEKLGFKLDNLIILESL